MRDDEIDGCVGAPVLKRDAIVDHLRSLIVTGQLKPGRRMPARSAIESQFRTGRRLVDQAFRRLEADGFVRNEPRQGTYVSENPPHLSRYAIVLGSDPEDLYGGFTAALRRQLAGIEKKRSCHFALYENMTGHSDTLEYQELLRDIQSHRLAGLMFRVDACGAALPNTPFTTIPGIPRVLISGDLRRAPVCPGVPIVNGAPRAFVDRALDYLLERGRRRIALLVGGEFTEDDRVDVLSRIGRRGMTTKRPWVLAFPLKRLASQVTELLLSFAPGERPDGLILATEALTESVGAGISASGAQPGRDLDVVASCNMPCEGPPLFPMRRLGDDMRERLRIALDLLDRQSRGEQVPAQVVLPAMFEDEVV